MRGPDLRHYLVAGGLLIGAGALLGVVVVLSGIYDISARRDHFATVTRLLEILREESIETQSAGLAVPPLADPALVRLGALHFETGCAPCHGAPGRPPPAFAATMLPAPPPLGDAAAERDPAALFWIVRNGLKYTGMPAWPADRPDEVWPVIAFLLRLETLDADGYQALLGPAAGPALAPDPADPLARLPTCLACHGGAAAAPVASQVPHLGGQSEGYLRRALTEYREGRRESGTMQLFAAALTEAEIAALAAHFAAQAAAQPIPLAGGAGDPARGERLYREGLPARDLPPCAACHEGPGAARFGRLAGLSADYAMGQLLNWQGGRRARSAEGSLMAEIALRLEAADRRDLAAFLGSPASLAGDGDAP